MEQDSLSLVPKGETNVIKPNDNNNDWQGEYMTPLPEETVTQVEPAGLLDTLFKAATGGAKGVDKITIGYRIGAITLRAAKESAGRGVSKGVPLNKLRPHTTYRIVTRRHLLPPGNS